ncbi:hypothetical protein SARC_08875 [Sphaeroforma arctica JP610]|uniref:Uncharacterized protein n=1 Tax=Sphaeroforma arctica JP610 TaxID=667725 RepID=A0A0L0FRW3_9EUKA|nr:hypothetical protein SARC_08875 [Sphaeroforma arctica JP610]KNC78703.1 hypothetical protein SARC_08875 [Sphaeroforma arctica JP610]|eukprot:XP_014152605.1 hypothetical protein SARC_08875 [Sphaeroforma arctica JP610]
MKFTYALHATAICATAAALDDNFTDFENVERGFVVAPASLRVLDENGQVASDSDPFLKMIHDDVPCPDTTAKEASDFYLKEVGPNTGANLTLAAVVFTHSHMDHFGGVLGLVDEETWFKGNIQIVAPLNFAEEALSENYMFIGNMGRRAWWQFANLLPANENATIHAGLSFTQSNSLFTYAAEGTLEITKDIETHTIAGITFEFMFTSNAETPAEMHT